MKFSSETVVGLKRLCHSTLVNEEQFTQLVKNCIQAVENDKLTNKKLEENSKLDVMKSAYSSLTVLVTEAARHGVDGSMLKNILEGYNLNPQRVLFIVEEYNRHRPSVRLRLQTIGTNLPHIIDIHWRLDYCLKSTCRKETLKPFFCIELNTITSGKRRTIRFVCSVQNLEELVFQLRGAVKHMNKLVSNSIK